MSKKIEVKRQNVFVDMTAMCDMAFLLLTFFILTAKFKPNEPVVVDVPASRAQIPIPESNIMTISVSTEGKTFMGVDNVQTRAKWLQRLGEKYGFQVTEQMSIAFSNIEQFGVNPAMLPQFLAMPQLERNKFAQPGITVPEANSKIDTVNFLKDMIFLARTAHEEVTNPGGEPNSDKALRIAVKSDKNTDYSMVDRVVATLVDSKINRFNLITNAKVGSTE
jgi:biopolymer transport protein ExbD